MKCLWVPLVRRNAKMVLVYIWDQILCNFPKKNLIESALFWICMLWHWSISFQEFKCEFKELQVTLDVLLQGYSGFTLAWLGFGTFFNILMNAGKAFWPAPVSVSPDPMRAGPVLMYSLGGPWPTGKAEKHADDAEVEVSG